MARWMKFLDHNGSTVVERYIDIEDIYHICLGPFDNDDYLNSKKCGKFFIVVSCNRYLGDRHIEECFDTEEARNIRLKEILRETSGRGDTLARQLRKEEDKQLMNKIKHVEEVCSQSTKTD